MDKNDVGFTIFLKNIRECYKMSSLRLINQIMSEELSVKDKIALFSNKKSTPVTPELHFRARKNSTTSDAIKQSYFGSSSAKGEEGILKQSSQQPISKTDSEIEALKVVDIQADEIVQLKAEISKYKSFVEVRAHQRFPNRDFYLIFKLYIPFHHRVKLASFA